MIYYEASLNKRELLDSEVYNPTIKVLVEAESAEEALLKLTKELPVYKVVHLSETFFTMILK